MLEHIWSGWRSSYVTASPVRQQPDAANTTAHAGSVFTQLLTSGASDVDTHIVHRSTTCFGVVNLFPYTTGHVLVVPYREVADLEDLTSQEIEDLWATVSEAVRVVRRAYTPDGVNVGLNLGRPAGGSVPEHLHVHIVPRWTGDSNFMSAIANTQTLPEALVDTATKLRTGWVTVTGERQ